MAAHPRAHAGRENVERSLFGVQRPREAQKTSTLPCPLARFHFNAGTALHRAAGLGCRCTCRCRAPRARTRWGFECANSRRGAKHPLPGHRSASPALPRRPARESRGARRDERPGSPLRDGGWVASLPRPVRGPSIVERAGGFCSERARRRNAAVRQRGGLARERSRVGLPGAPPWSLALGAASALGGYGSTIVGLLKLAQKLRSCSFQERKCSWWVE